MAVGRGRLYSLLLIVFLVIGISYEGFAWGKKKSGSKKTKTKKVSNEITDFLKKNGVDLKKTVKAISVTGQENLENGPRSVMKVIAIRDELSKGANKLSADAIKSIVAFIMEGEVVESGDTEKVADLEIFLEDGSSFKVLVGEAFSQIIFEKIIKKPKNPFSKEPVEKKVDVLSFSSPKLTKAIKLILKPKEPVR